MERAKPAVQRRFAHGESARTCAAADVGSLNRGHNSSNADPTGADCRVSEHGAQHTAGVTAVSRLWLPNRPQTLRPCRE
jgi:hypothetical protein